MSDIKVNRADLLNTLREIVEAHTVDPADTLVTLGTALIRMGRALHGMDAGSARRLLRSYLELEGV